MTFPITPTPARPADDAIIETGWGTWVHDLLLAVAQPPHCRLTRTTNQSIPGSAWTAMFLDTERVDVGGLHAAGATNRITVPAGGAGWWEVGASVEWQTGGGGARGLAIRLNGTLELTRSIAQNPTAVNIRCALGVHTAYQLADGDFLEAMLWHDVGAAQLAVASAAFSPEFYATRICN